MIEGNQKLASSRFGVNATPAVFVNNKKISSLDFDTIMAELGISKIKYIGSKYWILAN